MAWKLIEQPNKKMAIFSTVTDAYIAWDMTESELTIYIKNRHVKEAKADARHLTARMLKKLRTTDPESRSLAFDKSIADMQEASTLPENLIISELSE